MAFLEDRVDHVDKEARKYSREDFEFGKILGEGSYSTVSKLYKVFGVSGVRDIAGYFLSDMFL